MRATSRNSGSSRSAAEEEVLMTGYDTESDDEGGAGGMSGINMDVDITLADG